MKSCVGYAMRLWRGARLQPLFSAWKKKLPADVRVTYVPAAFGREWVPYAHAFYAADAMGLTNLSGFGDKAQSHTPLTNL